MGDHSPPPAKCSKLSEGSVNKNEIETKSVQEEYIEHMESKNSNEDEGNDEKEKTHASESSRRENVLVMRLGNKEQEVQGYIAQISQIKKAQEDTALLSLRRANLDPGVNLLFGKMCEELQQTKDKLEQAQSELSAWKFTPDSQNGKKLISRCRTLIAENQELGRQLSQGKSAQLEAELALQKKYSEELKASQDELNEFVIQLDEEVEGMQSTIQVLQQQLSTARQECEEYKKVISAHESNKEIRFAVTNHCKSSDKESDYCKSKLLVSPNAAADNDSENERHSENGDHKTTNNSRFHNVKHLRTSKQGLSDYDKRSGDVVVKNAHSDGRESTFGAQTKEYHNSDHESYPAPHDTPNQGQLSNDSDSWSKDGIDEARDNRTSIRCSDYSSDEEKMPDFEIENEEIDSFDYDTPCEDQDVITAHISAVLSPNHRRKSHSPHKNTGQRIKDIHENGNQPQSITLDVKSNNVHNSAYFSLSNNGDNDPPPELTTVTSPLATDTTELLRNSKKSSKRLHIEHSRQKNSVSDQKPSQLQEDVHCRDNADRIEDVFPTSQTSLTKSPFSNNHGVMQQNGFSDMSD